jgi:hypothetical protein
MIRLQTPPLPEVTQKWDISYMGSYFGDMSFVYNFPLCVARGQISVRICFDVTDNLNVVSQS